MSAELKTTKKYYLLLVDIKKSTSLPLKIKKGVFKSLDAQLEKINEDSRKKPILPLSRSYGDEVAGLFETARYIYEIVNHLREAIYPDASFRFVVAYGKIGMPSQDIRKIGGEVFKQADEAMRRLKKQDRFCDWLLKDPFKSEILNCLTEMSNVIFEQMTPYQRQVGGLLKQGLSQKEIAKRLKKFPQSVSEAVKRGKADPVLQAGKLINQILENT